MNAELEGYLDQLTSIRQDAPGLVSGLSDEQFGWRPAPNRWSIAECLGHLNVSAKLFIPTLDEAIAGGFEQGCTGSGPFAYPALQRYFVKLMEPPPAIRVRTPGALTPVYGASPEAIVRDFLGWQDQFQERLQRADGLDLRRVQARSPVLPWVHYSLGIGFAAFLAHERRHIWQARQVRRLPAFPGGVQRASSAASAAATAPRTGAALR